MTAPTAAVSYFGHATDCLCVPCMNADLESHIRATRTVADADRLLTELGSMPVKADAVRTRYATPGQRAGSGVVRQLSDKQLRLIRRLLAERDTTNLVWLPGSANIEKMSLKGASDLIERLFACPVRVVAESASVVRMATPKQVEWLAKLAGRDVPSWVEDIRVQGADATFQDASKALDVLFATPAPLYPARPTEVESLEGMHKLGDRIFKVQRAVHGSGNLYAKELVDGSFSYAAGMIRKLSADTRMTLDEAKAYGKLYGVCCSCARTLTDEASIAAGIGPICASKF